jgi:hypothetical protein
MSIHQLSAMSFSTQAAADLAGVTYRQADYWCRCAVLDPRNNGTGSGSGRARVWSGADVALLRVCGRLAELGAGVEVLQPVVQLLGLFPPVTWGGTVWVTADGQVHTERMPGAAAWAVDMDACLADLPLA